MFYSAECLSAVFEGRSCSCEQCKASLKKIMKERFSRSHMIEEVDHPEHYQSEAVIEVIDVIEAFELNFNLGNAIKYILRAGKKDNHCQDLKKALWYLRREIENVKQEEEYE